MVVALLKRAQSDADKHPVTPLEALVHPKTAPLLPKTTGELDTVIGPPPESVVVGVLEMSLPPDTSASCPFVQGDVVDRPSKEIVPVVVMVPPRTGHVVPIEDTVALDVLQVVHPRETVPPSETAPPPVSGEFAVTVTEEAASCELPMVEDEIIIPLVSSARSLVAVRPG